MSPGFVMGYSNLGNILKELGRLPEAEAAYRQALAIPRQLPHGEVRSGATAHQHGALRGGLAAMRRALRGSGSPSSIKPRRSLTAPVGMARLWRKAAAGLAGGRARRCDSFCPLLSVAQGAGATRDRICLRSGSAPALRWRKSRASTWCWLTRPDGPHRRITIIGRVR